MRARRYAVGRLVFDRDRQARGHVVGLYPSPLVARLADTAGFQWIARTVVCEPAAPPPAAPAVGEARDGVRVPAGRMPVDVPPTELRVGDQVLTGGRLIAITDLRYPHGGTRTMILANGRLAVAERTVRVYRPRAGRPWPCARWWSRRSRRKSVPPTGI
ncbi:hypothetical protein ADK52_20115 [Streptomyces sp. WM6372]|uniref:hypothetical protein n=1 Tax=Streptomyces sp. WM6372 TaxID=1415555 RepID=UPI0006AE4FB5|nr:hypothetical protein [Streptomyces sp. WM6372]KOU22733.1 hypothetical protein ADK52_20115 [Streptomyces sp. WM6372]